MPSFYNFLRFDINLKRWYNIWKQIKSLKAIEKSGLIHNFIGGKTNEYWC